MRDVDEPRTLTVGEKVRLFLERVGGSIVAVLAVVLVVALLAVAVIGWTRYGKYEPSKPLTTYPEAGGRFAGTLADSYPAGADGIVLPQAEATGPFSAEQVAAALKDVRRALIALRLDRRMLVERREDVFLSLLSPSNRAELTDTPRRPGAPRYAPQVASYALLTEDKPRVRGEMTYRVVAQDGMRGLEVTARFVWVYAFKTDSAYAYGDLVTVADKTVWHVMHPNDIKGPSSGLSLHDSQIVVWNADCVALREGYLTPLPDQKARAERNVDGVIDPNVQFDPRQSLNNGEDC